MKILSSIDISLPFLVIPKSENCIAFRGMYKVYQESSSRINASKSSLDTLACYSNSFDFEFEQVQIQSIKVYKGEMFAFEFLYILS